MNPKEIPENLELAQNLLSQWLRYRQFYYKGISKDPITPQEEAEFLEISSSIAQAVRKLVQRLSEAEFPFRSSEITTQLRSTISVAHFRNLPAADQKVFYKDWHISLIYLGRTVGALKFINDGYRPANGVSRPVGGKKANQTSPGTKGPAPGSKGAPKGGKGKKKGGGGGAGKVIAIIVTLVILAVAGFFFFK